MSSVTRNLMAYALSRTAAESVQFNFETSTPKLDGSFTVVTDSKVYKARMVDLQADDIQRLQEGGMTIHAGASVSVPYQFDAAPDSLIWQGVTYKILQSTLAEGVSIFVIDKTPIGFSNVEQSA